MLWKGTELRNSSCSKESDKSLEELSVADLKALMDYLSEMMDLCRENMAFRDRYVMYEEGFAAVHEEWEKDFIALLAGWSHSSIEKVEELVTWWKLKNKWKRSLSSDDAKAYRMILRKLKNEA